jgi:uncharacterized protein YjiS (DUF1127 family)
MANPTFSLTLGDVSTAQHDMLIARVISRYVTARSTRALAELSQYDSLVERLGRTLGRRGAPRRPTLSWLFEAQVSLWRTVDELGQRSDRTLSDIQIPREAIRAVAVLSTFGSPSEVPGARQDKKYGPLATLRRRLFPTELEHEEAYLAGAADVYDLELSMNEWDRRQGRMPPLLLNV